MTGRVTFPEPCPEPACRCVMKLGGPLSASPELFSLMNQEEGMFVPPGHLSRPRVHASPRSRDARTSIRAFGELVCSVSEVRGAQAGSHPSTSDSH